MLPEAGMKIPAITIRTKTEEGIEELETASYFAGRKIVMFAVPGGIYLNLFCQTYAKLSGKYGQAKGSRF